jgi:CBS-domain-containing membrane protein
MRILHTQQARVLSNVVSGACFRPLEGGWSMKTTETGEEILREKGNQVRAVTSKATVYDALKLISEEGIGAVTVIEDEGEVKGIMTERDYARNVILIGKVSQETSVKGNHDRHEESLHRKTRE